MIKKLDNNNIEIDMELDVFHLLTLRRQTMEAAIQRYQEARKVIDERMAKEDEIFRRITGNSIIDYKEIETLSPNPLPQPKTKKIEVKPSGDPSPSQPLTQFNQNTMIKDIIECLKKNKNEFKKGMDINQILFSLQKGGRNFNTDNPAPSLYGCLHKYSKKLNSGVVREGDLWRYEIR